MILFLHVTEGRELLIRCHTLPNFIEFCIDLVAFWFNYWMWLLAGTVPAFKKLLAGTVPAFKRLLAGTHKFLFFLFF